MMGKNIKYGGPRSPPSGCIGHLSWVNTDMDMTSTYSSVSMFCEKLELCEEKSDIAQKKFL